MEGYVTTREMAKILGVSQTTVCTMYQKGIGPERIRIPGVRDFLYKRDEVISWKETGRTGEPTHPDWVFGPADQAAKDAMEKANVAIVPGSAFGAEGYVRFSYGEKPQVLKEGIASLAKWLKNK